MSTRNLRRSGVASVAALALALLIGCGNSTGGTAAVAPNATLPSSTTSTAGTTATTRPAKPTETATSTTTDTSTTESTTESTDTALPTDTRGEPMPSSASALGVGDCYTVGDDSVVSPIDCAELHDGQVFKTEVALPGVEPGETDVAKLFDGATPACSADFELFVGVPLTSEKGRYSLAIVWQSSPNTAVEVACAVVDKSGAQWAGSAENVSGSYRGIDIGDCFDYPTATANAVELPCDQPHDAEMYVMDAPLGLDAPETPYPTEAQWQELSATICIGPFADYTGQTYESALDLAYTYVFPLEPDWPDLSQRKLSCAITSIDGTKLVGSKHA